MFFNDLVSSPGFIRAGGKHGGEYHGPCPVCGGNDRFHVWPEQPTETVPGRYWCRQCGIDGDAIQFLRDVERLSYSDACSRLGLSSAGVDRFRTPRAPRRRGQSVIPPETHEPPSEQWREHAQKFVDYAHEQLLATPERLAWLAARGVGVGSVERGLLGFNPQAAFRARSAWNIPNGRKPDGSVQTRLWIPPGIVIPYYRDGVLHRVKIRRDKPVEFGAPYVVLPGSSLATFVTSLDATAYVVNEAELDALAEAEACGWEIGAIGLGSDRVRPDAETHAALEKSLAILLALDFDKAGAEAARRWSAYSQSVRWPVPAGKDAGEYFEQGGDLHAWILAGLPPVFRVPARGDEVGTSEQCASSVPGGTDSAVGGGGRAPSEPSGGDEPGGVVAAERPAVPAPDCASDLRGLLAHCDNVSVVSTPDELGVRCVCSDNPAECSRRRKISELVFGDNQLAEWIESIGGVLP